MKVPTLAYVGPLSQMMATIKRQADAAETALLLALATVLLTAALLGYLSPAPAATRAPEPYGGASGYAAGWHWQE